MGHHTKATKIIETVKDGKYVVEIQFEGNARIGKFDTQEEAKEFLEQYKESTMYVPTWSEVTGNGRWSCD